jgi:hypothetical protein
MVEVSGMVVRHFKSGKSWAKEEENGTAINEM